MPLTKQNLLDFLSEIDEKLEKKIILVAAGGTALTLLNSKDSTKDVDFTIPHEHYDEFKKAEHMTQTNFRVDVWTSGLVFSQQLPDDYLEKSIFIKTQLKNIELRALNPIDIIVTKIGRLDERDQQDIKVCIKKFKITKSQILKRGKQVEYTGREENYLINLNHVIVNFKRYSK